MLANAPEGMLEPLPIVAPEMPFTYRTNALPVYCRATCVHAFTGMLVLAVRP